MLCDLCWAFYRWCQVSGDSSRGCSSAWGAVCGSESIGCLQDCILGYAKISFTLLFLCSMIRQRISLWQTIERLHAWHTDAARGGTVFAFNWLSHGAYKPEKCLICDRLSSDLQRLLSNRLNFNLERNILKQQLANAVKTAKCNCSPNDIRAFWILIKHQIAKAKDTVRLLFTNHQDVVNWSSSLQCCSNCCSCMQVLMF